MKVAEGIVRYCPVTELFQKGQGMMNQDNNQQDQHNENQNSTQPPPNIPPELADSIKNALE